MNRANVARLAALAGIWGSSFLLIKLALAGLSPAQIVLGRLVLAAGVLLVVVAVRRQPLPRTATVWGQVALMSIVANIVPFYLFAWGEQRISSGMAGVLNGTTPLFTLVIAMIALSDERWSPTRISGLLMGFVGVVLVVAPWNDSGANALSGQLACLGAGACYGVSFVYTRRFLTNRGLPALALSAAQLSMAAVLLLLAAPLVAATPVQLSPSVVGSIVALGAIGTGFAYLLFYRLIAEVGAMSASMVTYLIPVVSVILGVVVLSEPLGWNVFVGAGIVIAGVAVAEGRLGSGSTVSPPPVAATAEAVNRR
ncbi:MAG: DMT family transporter [Acidimicrobiia bacterium]|nr:DMT family transporter [Acidimicrobiia bacterium]MDQ3537297.1 DMT family transporter [Actinomycetota bacterium]